MHSKRLAAAVGLGAAALLTFAPMVRAGTADGQGAQKSTLSPNTGSVMHPKCQEGSGAGNGWAILNKTGAPAAMVTAFQGEVHLIKAPPNTTYMIELASTS